MTNDHDILIRMDERTELMAKQIDAIEGHLSIQNGRVRKLETRVAQIIAIGSLLVVVVNIVSRLL